MLSAPDLSCPLTAEAPPAPARPGRWHLLPRAMALFLGGFSLLNLLGELLHPNFSANIWWIDIRPLPAVMGHVGLFLAALFLLSLALRPAMSPWRRRATRLVLAGLLGLVLFNAMNFYHLLEIGTLRTAVPLPASIFIAAALLGIYRGTRHRQLAPPTGGQWLAAALALAGCIIAFPLMQMFCFGKTDYRRGADAIVVFGAGVQADGTPSDALTDRVRTAAGLYQQGYADTLILSGGPGPGQVHETQAMAALARKLGVPAAAIVLDPDGVNTGATVRNTTAVFRQMDARRILVVSHFYHLPRVKMAYQRAGWDVYTVPAEESYLLSGMPYYMAREVAALWSYYFQPLAG